MFTKKPEPGESVTKLGERPSGEAKSSPFTERPATYAKAPSPAASKMVPSIIGEDLTISGNVNSKGEIQVDGDIQGDINCGSLLLGDKSHVNGNVVAEDVVVRGRVVGSIRGLRVTLQAQSHVEGDIFHQSLAIEQGAYFEGKSRRSDDPLAELRAEKAAAPAPTSSPSTSYSRTEKSSDFGSETPASTGGSTSSSTSSSPLSSAAE
jgi:cytoskeletal protein CcmA (bactofilin family)